LIQQKQPSILVQASWGWLEMKHIGVEKTDTKTKVEKKQKKRRVIKNQIEKGGKAIKMKHKKKGE
jgi:hypothetical protein